MKNFPLLLFGIYLFLAPLHWAVPSGLIPGPQGLSWNGQGILLGLVLLMYYFFSIKNPQKYLDKKSVLLSLFLTISILFVTLVIDRGQVVPEEVTRFVCLAWLVPLIVTLLKLYGRLAVVTLTIAIAVLHAQWAVAQFVLQHDLHLYLLGETRLSINGIGIAKFLTSTYKLIRAYGPYAHPNILSGVLAISLILWAQVKWQSRLTTFSLLGALVIGMIVTFSRAAWLSGGITIALWLLSQWRSSTSEDRLSMKRTAGFITITLLVFIPLSLDRSTDYQDVATNERLSGLQTGQEIWREHPWTGTGIGNYRHVLTQYMERLGLPYQPWEIAPIHIVPVLLLAEWGILGIITMIVSSALYSIYTHVNLVSYFKLKKSLWLLPTAPLLLLDHYLLTQTAPMVWYLVLLAGLWLAQESLTDVQ